MALYPPANQRPVVNHSGPRTGKTGIVLHVTQGFGSPFDSFDNSAFQASSHFWIGVDGTVEQYVDTDLIAWAQMAGNETYVSCETEGFGVAADGQPATGLTDAQLQALAELLAWSHLEDGWALQLVDHGGDGFTCHCHYPSGEPDPAWGDHTCPGPIRMGQMPQLLEMVESLLAPAPAPVTPTVPTPPAPDPFQEDPMKIVMTANAPVTNDAHPVFVTCGLQRGWLTSPAEVEAWCAYIGQPFTSLGDLPAVEWDIISHLADAPNFPPFRV